MIKTLQILLLLAPALFGDSASGSEGEARQILANANRATEAARQIRYDWAYWDTVPSTGRIAGRLKLSQGKRMEDSSFWARALESEFPEDRGWPAIDFTIATDGKHAQWIELKSRNFHRSTVAKGGLGVTTNAYYGIFVEFAVPNPFGSLLKEERLSLAGRKHIGGVECDGVRFVRTFRGGGEETITWYFGREDHLPRAQYHQIRTPVFENDYFMEIYNLETGIQFAPGEFALNPPPGFKVIDDDLREIAVGAAAPPWRLHTSEGVPVSLTDLRGKVTVLVFWTSTCPVCRAYLEKVDRMMEGLDGKLVRAFAINIGEPSEALYRAYLKRARFKLPILEKGGRVAADYKSAMTPGVYAVGKDGRLIYASNGVASALQIAPLREAIEAELGSSPGDSSGGKPK